MIKSLKIISWANTFIIKLSNYRIFKLSNYQIIAFSISILFTLFLPSCSPNYLKDYTKLENTDLIKPAVFDHNFKKVTYKTKFDLMGNQLSGILLIKQTKEKEFRFVFVSEIGIKYFDLGIKPLKEGYFETSHYLMPALNRGNVEQILFDDFGKLIKPQYASPSQTFFRNKNKRFTIFTIDFTIHLFNVYFCFIVIDGHSIQ